MKKYPRKVDVLEMDEAKITIIITDLHCAFRDVPMPNQEQILAEFDPEVQEYDDFIKGKTWMRILSDLKSLDVAARNQYRGMSMFMYPAELHYLTPVFLDLVLTENADKPTYWPFLDFLLPYSPEGDDPGLDDTLIEWHLHMWNDFYRRFTLAQKRAVLEVINACDELLSPGTHEFWRRARETNDATG